MRICIFLFYVLALVRPTLAVGGEDPGKTGQAREGALGAVTMELEDEHFCAPVINDSFSRLVWNRFLTVLDRDKDVYLHADLRALSPFATLIDDEMHASSTVFFDTAVSLYRLRLLETQKIWNTLLDQPLTPQSNLKSLPTGDKADFPADSREKEKIWARRIRTEVLNKMIDLQTTEPKAGFAQLEKEARERVRRSLEMKYRMALAPAGEDNAFSQYINVITACADPHTTYFAPVASRSATEQLSRRYYGLGMELNVADGPVIIQRLFPGGPAFKSGLLRVNDRILGVGDASGEITDVSEMNATDVTQLIRGDKGTTVRLLIDRPGSGRSTVTLERGEIIDQQTGIRSAVIHRGDKTWGYIYLPEFYDDAANPDGPHCARDVAAKIGELKSQGARGIVIDLRNNPGGSVTEVAEMASLFINAGPVVQLKGKDRIRALGKNGDTSKMFYDGPMTVLVNESSASASEIFAAAMQDYRRAIVIGSPTYGKGTAQENRALGKMGDKLKGIPNISYGSMRLTTMKFYRVTGNATQLKGVIPDVVLPDGGDELPIREKDGFAPLPWDHIAPLPFTPCEFPTYGDAIGKAIQRVNADTGLASVRRQAAWLIKHTGESYPLDLAHYREQMAAIKTHQLGLVAAAALPADHALDLQGLEKDTSVATTSRPGLIRQQDSALSRDAVLLQAINVLQDLAGDAGDPAPQAQAQPNAQVQPHAQARLVLDGTISGLSDDSVAYLTAFTGGGMDSVHVRDHRFRFDGTLRDGGDVYTLRIGRGRSRREAITLYLGPGDVRIDGRWPEFDSAVITGSPFVGEWKDVQQMIRSVATAGLDKETRKNKLTQLGEDWVTAHPNSGVSAFVIDALITPGIPRKEIAQWMDKLTQEAQDNAIADDLHYRLDADVTNAPGHPAPLFTAPDTSGRLVSLADFRGKYVLLDFWASWCGGCPQLDPVYKSMCEKLKGRNFVMLGVSLDLNRTAWLNAIRREDLSWTQLCAPDGRGGSKVAKLYHVVGVPANFLIDPNGVIIGTNIGDIETLESKMHSTENVK